MATPSPSFALAITGLLAVTVLLSQFAMLRQLKVRALVPIYLVQSLGVCGLTGALGLLSGRSELYVLAALTFATKGDRDPADRSLHHPQTRG